MQLSSNFHKKAEAAIKRQIVAKTKEENKFKVLENLKKRAEKLKEIQRNKDENGKKMS